MKTIITGAFILCIMFLSAQPVLKNSADPAIITLSTDGTMALSAAGASYFAKLSLDCANKIYPHYYNEQMTVEKPEDLKTPEKLWPSFYGCFDWHSGVHNHWALVKLLKTYPNIPEAKYIKQKLDQSFDAKNILAEMEYLKSHEEANFEFPYGTSWLLKVADELQRWNDPVAKKWMANLKPLSDYIASTYLDIWPQLKKPRFSGDHYASSLGLSFAYDYAVTMKNDALKNLIAETSKKYYIDVTGFPLAKEPFNYDFMSAGLLITDLMRKILTQEEFTAWVKQFSPDMFTVEGVKKVFKVDRKETHTGYAAHFDGFHLNRIWCINGMLHSLAASALTPEVKQAWIAAQKEMWDYSQASIGKGNYDVDHWLSSFSVYALTGIE